MQSFRSVDHQLPEKSRYYVLHSIIIMYIFVLRKATMKISTEKNIKYEY